MLFAMMKRLLQYVVTSGIVTAAYPVLADAPDQTRFVPIELSVGSNPISNVDGKGTDGFVDVYWRGNGNAWGYNLFVTNVGGEIAIHETDNGMFADFFQNSPHVEEDFVRSVRFATAPHRGVKTLHVLVANRLFKNSVPEPAKTIISVYALVETDGSVGTTFQFEKRYDFNPTRLYCNADMALKTELNIALPKGYSGSTSSDGCFE
jgi:hypothetical protein